MLHNSARVACPRVYRGSRHGVRCMAMGVRWMCLAVLMMCAIDLHAGPAYLPFSQVRAGQQGYGLTVFQGSTPERFNVRVLGVMPKTNGGRGLILIKMDGGPLVTRHVNIAGGMSGSPVYVNDRLIGAVSMMAMSFPAEPHALVTPIEDMLEAWDPLLPPAPRAAAPSDRPKLDGRWTGGLTLAIGGACAATRNRLQARLGVSQTAMAGSRDAPGAVQPLRPGSSLGVGLITGDVDVSAVGTLTAVDGKRVLMFGHPLLQLGAIEAPLLPAVVLDTVPGVMRSEKFAVVGRPIGVVTQDRPFAMAGHLGGTAVMTPVTVRVDDPEGKRSVTLRTSVLRHPMLSEMLIDTVVYEAVSRVAPAPAELTASIRTTVRTDRLPEYSSTNRVSGDRELAPLVSAEVLRVASTPLGYREMPVTLTGLNVTVTIQRGLATRRILGAALDKAQYRPGETASIRVWMRSQSGVETAEVVNLTVPRGLRNGAYTLTVGAGGVDSTPGGLRLIGAVPAVQTPEESVRQLLERPANNELAARLVLPNSALSVQGQRLVGLPAPLRLRLAAAWGSQAKPDRDDVLVRAPLDAVVLGRTQLTLRVNDGSSGSSVPMDSLTANLSLADLLDEEENTDGGEGLPFGLDVSAASSLQAAVEEARSTAGDPAKQKEAPSDTVTVVSDAPAPSSVRRGQKQPDGSRQWRLKTAADWRGGTPNGLAVLSTGGLVPVPVWKTDAPDALTQTVEVAYSPSGMWSIGGIPSVARLWRDGEVVRSIPLPRGRIAIAAAVSGDQLIVSMTPGAHLVRITPDGAIHELDPLEAACVSVLYAGTDGSVYAGTSRPARVYRVWPERSLITGLNADSVTCITGTAGALAIGSGAPAGAVVIAPDGTHRQLAVDAGGAVSAIGMQPSGRVAVSLYPQNSLMMFGPEGGVVLTVRRMPGTVHRLEPYSDDWLAFGVGGAWLIRADGSFAESTGQNETWIASCCTEEGPSAISATGRLIRPQTGGHWYETPVLDAGNTAHWLSGTVWTQQGVGWTEISTGVRPSADAEGWSEWHSVSSNAPAGRYARFRVHLGEKDARVEQLVATARVENRAPTCRLLWQELARGVKDKATIKWTQNDPDGDSLIADLWYRRDGSDVWQRVPTQSSQASASPKPDGESKPDASGEKTGGSKSSDASSDEEAQARALMDSLMEATSERPSGNGQTSQSWDTSALPEGVYFLRLQVSDRVSRADALSSEIAESGPIPVTRTPPLLRVRQQDVRLSDGRVRVSGRASHPVSPIVQVEYRFGSGKWLPALPVDGAFDSDDEMFAVDASLDGEAGNLVIRAKTAAGTEVQWQQAVKTGTL